MLNYTEEDLLTPIRQGGIDNRPFWNTYAKQFIYAPALEFARVDGATAYSFLAEDRYHKIHSFVSQDSCAPLSPIWNELPVGPIYLTVEALNATGKTLKTAGFRVFYKNAPFTDSYPAKVRTYAESAKLAYDYLFNMKEIQELATGKPNLDYELFCYPSKMYSSIISGMVNYAEMVPEMKEKAHAIAKGAANYLIEKAVPAGTPLEYLPQTYEGDKLAAKKFPGIIMMLYPAGVGFSMLQLHEATDETKYLEYATRIGEQYLRLQQPNGSWFLNLNIADGMPKEKNYCTPTGIMSFLEKLANVTQQTKYRNAAQNGMPYLRRMMDSFDWEGQFEDVEAQQVSFSNMTFHNATAMYLYLCKGNNVSDELIREAREIQRYSEDQFIVWEQPGWAGSFNEWNWRTKEELQTRAWGWFKSYHVPSTYEQYRCYVPIDGASCKMIRYFLMMYDLEKNPLDLAKARALGDSLTRLQEPNGRIPTWADRDRPVSEDWINCMYGSANALKLLASYDEK